MSNEHRCPAVASPYQRPDGTTGYAEECIRWRGHEHDDDEYWRDHVDGYDRDGDPYTFTPDTPTIDGEVVSFYHGASLTAIRSEPQD